MLFIKGRGFPEGAKGLVSRFHPVEQQVISQDPGSLLRILSQAIRILHEPIRYSMVQWFTKGFAICSKWLSNSFIPESVRRHDVFFCCLSFLHHPRPPILITRFHNQRSWNGKHVKNTNHHCFLKVTQCSNPRENSLLLGPRKERERNRRNRTSKRPTRKALEMAFAWSNEGISRWWFQITDLQSHVVLTGQVKQYFACESQHQHGAFDKTGGFKYFLFSSLFGEDSHGD